MAQKLDPKKAFTKNRVKIVQGLGNPDDVASHLFTYGLFTQEMMDTILEEEEKEKKNRKILDTLNYRGKKAVKALHDAFLDTENKELAELLAEYVKVIEIDDNRFSPSVWPPLSVEQKRMESEPIRRIKDKKSPLVAHEYTNSEVYKMRNKTRGMVFMINNVNFSKEAKLSTRDGSDIDADNLRKLFVGLQFKVVEKKDQGGQEMLDVLKEERDKVIWKEMECMILIIMSHGDTTGIYGKDGVSVGLHKFTDIFKECPELNEKPKLVFVQACRGTITETGEVKATETDPTKDKVGIQVSEGMEQLTVRCKDETDASTSEISEVPIKNVHSEADFLIAYATPEGTPAYRNIEVGSWFLNAIVWTFKYHADQQEIQHLLTKVNQLVSQGRTLKGHLTVSEISSKLRKKFYFFPGIYNDPPELLEE